jgi:hypothetical protein
VSVEDRAAFLLRHPEQAGLHLLVKGRRVILRIVHEPAFTAHRSWSLYAPSQDDARLLVLRLTREPSVDPIDPKLVNRVAYLDPAAAANLLVEGAAIRVPVFDNGRRHGIGIDGEIWTFRSGDLFTGASLEWWCDGPPEWKPFADWARRVAAFLDSAHEARD